MRTLFLFSIVSFLFNSVAFSQDGLKVEYQVRFNDDFDRGRNDRLHKASLLVSNGNSKYFMQAQQEYKKLNDNDHVFSPDTSMVIYTNQNNGVLLAKEFGLNGQSFFLSDSLYPMQWEITEEEKKLDRFSCIKAKCQFRGRQYIAWFTPDLALPFGPWKMGGLPGLILDLEDVDENLVIRMTGISPSAELINQPVVIKYTMAEHISETQKLIRQIKSGARANSSGDCLTCTGHSSYSFYFWEKIPQ
jgi:GLPGLI family protein